jgi:hypothetical protein
LQRLAALLKEDVQEEDQPEPSPAVFLMGLEDLHVKEDETAKFLVKVAGFPRPHLIWYINKSRIVNVSVPIRHNWKLESVLPVTPFEF